MTGPGWSARIASHPRPALAGRRRLIRVGINGLGSVGRAVLRVVQERADRSVAIVAVNDPAPPSTLAHLLRHDSGHDRWRLPIEHGENHLLVDGHRIECLHREWTEDLDWGRRGVEIVVETPRGFRGSESRMGHCVWGGARKVVLTMADPGADVTVIAGLNDHDYDPARHLTIAAAEPATLCAAPMLEVLHTSFGVETAALTALHGLTGHEGVIPALYPDPRRSRFARDSLYATGLAAPTVVTAVLPQLTGGLVGAGVHSPMVKAALLGITARLMTPADREQVNDAFRSAADGPLKRLMRCTDGPAVSSDALGDAASCLFDPALTRVTGDLAAVFGWSDPRWSYAHRVAELLELVARRGTD